MALVAFVGYNFYQFQQSGGVAQTATAPTDAAPDAEGTGTAQTGAAVPAVSKQHKGQSTLDVRITQASWLLVKVDGKQRLEGILPAGTRKQFHGSTATIRAGNAGGVHLAVNGRQLGTMGPSGAVVDRTIELAAE